MLTFSVWCRCNCDACGGSIIDSRIICLNCKTTNTWNSVDLCENPSCIETMITRSDLTRPHPPTHDFVKIRRMVHLPYIGIMERDAHSALEHARSIFSGRDSGQETNELLKCLFCKERVQKPCWYCVKCEGNYSKTTTIYNLLIIYCLDPTFICNACDSLGNTAFGKIPGYNGSHAFDTHDLVRCTDKVEDEEELSMETRLDRLENWFRRHEGRMEERLSKMEGILEGISRVLQSNSGLIGICP